MGGVFTLKPHLIESFGGHSRVIGKCVWLGSDGPGNDVGVWAFKNLLVKDCPPMPRPPP